MKRIVFVLFILLFLVTPLFATSYFDFSLMVGQGNYTWPLDGIGVSYGMTFGLTDTLELDVWGVSEVIPEPFGSTLLGAELSLSLLGQRNTGSKVSGVNMNSIISLGGFWKSDDNGCGVMVGITPVAIGSPSLTKRERCLRTNIGWDFRNSRLIVVFSPLDVEVFLKGTYRDWV